MAKRKVKTFDPKIYSKVVDPRKVRRETGFTAVVKGGDIFLIPKEGKEQ